MTHRAPADYRGGVVLNEVAGLESVIGRMIEPLMAADHLKSCFDDRAFGLPRRPQLLRGFLSGGVGWSGQVSPTRASRIAAVVTP